jgi:hypothetical protein
VEPSAVSVKVSLLLLLPKEEEVRCFLSVGSLDWREAEIVSEGAEGREKGVARIERV